MVAVLLHDFLIGNTLEVRQSEDPATAPAPGNILCTLEPSCGIHTLTAVCDKLGHNDLHID